MRINNNISALNAWRGLTNTDNSLSKSLEKLSSGLRINRAGDDAAGLAISEKMRGQIRGLNMAIKNAQDGISLIQTAEGALTESHAILQRMRELAVQSANDTNTVDDRKELQKELNQLIQELDRNAANTEFNTKTLLDGSFSGKIHIGANSGQAMDIAIESMHTQSMGETTKETFTAGGGALNSDYSGTPGKFTVTVDGQDYVVSVSTNADASAALAAVQAALVDSGVQASDNSGNLKLTSDKQFTIKDNTGALVSSTTVTQAEETVVASIKSLVVDLDTDDTGGILTQVDADNAITAINKAIQTVSGERSKLGAFQNRLEHTIKNLGVASENLAAAESRIRDVDMAAEMMNFTKQNILMQAGTAMLAQANARPQSVLQLLG